MEIWLSDDKYWATNLFRVQNRFLVFIMFFWWYNNVTRDLLHTAVAFNLVYLASMSILDTPPGDTWKFASKYELNPAKVTQEWMKELSENDCSEYWAAQLKERVGVPPWCMLAWYQPSPYLQDPLPSPLPSFWKVWARVTFSEGSLVAI